MSRKGPKSARERFAEQLARHLEQGTRPHIPASATIGGERWTDAEFATAIDSTRTAEEAERRTVSDRTVATWRKGSSLPTTIGPILLGLFGTASHHAAVRERLRKAYDAAVAEKHRVAIERAKERTAPAWQPSGDQMVSLPVSSAADTEKALDPLRRQQQVQLAGFADELLQSGVARIVGNSPIWHDLPRYVSELHGLLVLAPEDLDRHLGTLYGLLLRLAAYLNTNKQVKPDPAKGEYPLPHELESGLSALVGVMSPWLLGFPVVAAWDEAAGHFLARVDKLLKPASAFMRSAGAQSVISDDEARKVATLLDAAQDESNVGAKAGNRAIGYANNLVMAFAEARQEPAHVSQTLQSRIDTLLATPEARASELIAAQPQDVQDALGAILTGESRGNEIEDGAESPAFTEADVIKRLSDGRVVPEDWIPRARSLNVWNPNSKILSRIPELVSLEHLKLSGLNISDTEGIGTLKQLKYLGLGGTKVRDAGPLASLVGITELDLWGTDVVDIAPLSALTQLTRLILRYTRVRDLGPLAGLLKLRHLDLQETRVVDLSPLANLREMAHLYLRGAPVEDISPLARMTQLETLDLNGTQVRDLAPLAGLRALRHLDIRGTSLRSAQVPIEVSVLLADDVNPPKRT